MGQAKIDALTGLRFLAAALIVVEHAAWLRIPIPPAAYDHAVSLFFVLSGFILSYAYPRLVGWDEIKRFFILRVAPSPSSYPSP